MYKHVKRIIDIILSIVLLILLSPVILLVSILIKLESPGPILFRQERVGLNNKSIVIYKFRTMKISAPSVTPTSQLADPYLYITNVGKFLRRMSIDEIPQVINILKGEMSLIGPRPVIWNDKELIKERNKLDVYTVLPGLTGWSQINGRDSISDFEKAKLDEYYIRNISFIFDMQIFFGTIKYVLTMNNIVEGMNKSSECDTPTKHILFTDDDR